MKLIELKNEFDMNCLRIENILELNEIQDIIKNGVIHSKSIGDHVIVKNYYDMINYLYETVKIGCNLDLNIIEKINIMLSRDGTMKEKSVRYREEKTPFVKHFFFLAPESDSISPQMNQLINDYKELRGRYNPVYVGCYVHNELLRIYPFEENNEAVARALLNFVLISEGYLPVMYKMDQGKYYEAARMHINKDDGRPFYELIMRSEKETYVKYIELLLNAGMSEEEE